MGERLCEAVGVRAGQSLLDIPTGSGNTALSAARRFTKVTGIDYVPDLLTQASARASAEGLPVNLLQGDTEQLEFPNGSFDVVLSSVGVVFAPNQSKTASANAMQLVTCS